VSRGRINQINNSTKVFFDKGLLLIDYASDKFIQTRKAVGVGELLLWIHADCGLGVCEHIDIKLYQ